MDETTLLGLLEPAVEVAPTATVQATARRMSKQKVGVAAVVEGGRIVGIVTERDLVRRATALGPEGARLRARDAMTRPVESVAPSATVLEAAQLMRQKRIRHLAIVDDRGRYLGTVALRRLLFQVMDELDLKVDNLERELMIDGPGG